MKRNMKFLLLLAIFTSSIMAAYFITGCGDDSTVIEFPENVTNDTTVIIEETDQVIGTVHGTVSDGWDNAFLAGVTITWINGDSTYTTTTDAGGYWSTPVDLVSGEYEFTFSVTGHAVTSGWTTIPELDDLRGGVADRPAGNIYVSDTLDMRLLPLTANVTGKVYTALPAPPVKDGEPSLALDDPTLVSVAEGVTVILDYGFDIHPNKYTATTIANGTYTFNNVPLWVGAFGDEAPKAGQPGMALATAGEVDLMTLPFTEGSSTFEGTMQRNISMVPGTTEMSNIFAPLDGGTQVVTNRPVILTYTFETPGFLVTDDLEINFSKPMDTATVRRAPIGFTEEFDYSWDVLNMVLTINPALSLVPDNNYVVTISGKSADGLWLLDTRNEDGDDDSTTWQRTLVTQSGIRFVATNLDDFGEDFTDFPLGNSITIDFDMDVDSDNANGWVTLLDATNNREVNATISASGVTVTVNPADDLKSFNTYELDFRIYSNLRGDFEDDDVVTGSDLTFTSVNMAETPAAPTGFVLDMGAGWKADFDDLVIDFKWDSVSGAEYYQIFAKDNHLNTDFIVVNPYIEDISYYTWQTGTVNFAASDSSNVSFDLFFDDMGLQTPFSDYTEVTFQIRAVNSAGAGAFSAEITVGDETAPSSTDINLTQTGDADNAGGAVASSFDLGISQVEYVDSIHFVFIEGGADPAFVLTEDEVTWTWGVDMRNGAGVVSVAAGATASVDTLIVQIWDNSGNMGADTIQLEPWIEFVEPNAATTDFMAPSFLIDWTSVDDNDIYKVLDLYLSLDGGTTWFDTVQDIDETPGEYTYGVDDTLFSTNAMVALQDTVAGGGWMWVSDVFTWAGLELTGPDQIAWRDANTIYDEEGVDSLGVPLTWDYAGLDSMEIWWWNDDANAWALDSVIEATGSPRAFTWYPPDIGIDYACSLYVGNIGDDAFGMDSVRPGDTLVWGFDVIHDFVNITAPVTGEWLPGGADYDIEWDTVYVASSEVALAYIIGEDTTWIDTVANSGTYTWAVPANTPSNLTARIVMFDKLSNRTVYNVLSQTGLFGISGITITAPIAGQEWLVGSGQDIMWTEVDGAPAAVGDVDIWWSRDGFNADSTILFDDYAGGSPRNFTVPANSACSTVTIRVYGQTDAVYAESPEMTFAGVIVTSPISGNLAQGAATSITWVTIGATVGATVDIEYKYITTGPPPVTSGWITLASATENDSTWTWSNIPEPPAEQAWVRIKKAGTVTGGFEGGEFSISGLVVVVPNGLENWPIRTAHDITWNVINPVEVGDVTIELRKDPGGALISTLATDVDGALETWPWMLDATLDASATYYIRIFAQGVSTIEDVSDDWFEIPLDVTLTVPNGGETWVLDSAVAIEWTDNGLANPVKLEYSVDNGVTWPDIATADAIAAGTNTFNWTLDDAVDGDLEAAPQCFVRITTNAGPAAGDTSDLVFVIQPSVLITAPNVLVTWTINGAGYDITWDHMGQLDNVKLEYTLDASAGESATWFAIATAGNLAPGAGTFTWALDNTADTDLVASLDCKVRVTSTTDATVFDVSDVVFEIDGP